MGEREYTKEEMKQKKGGEGNREKKRKVACYMTTKGC